jgi:molecular chaperone GrpE
MPMDPTMPADNANSDRESTAAEQPRGTEAAEAQPDAVSVLEAEKAELKDKLLRTLADVENMRRRSEREAADARAYAVTNFARDMLNTADNIRRAIEAVPEGASASDPSLKAFVEGVELTERDFLKSLERHGVRRLEPKGSKFDPNMHQAMFEVPNPDVPTGTVVEVVQTGYAIGERVLRPAMVGVARGGPKTAAPTETSEASGTTA